MRTKNMRILIVGSGAREHALAIKIATSPRVAHVLCTPGNGGLSDTQIRDVKADDLEGLVQLAKDESIDLVVIGPEVPLIMGIVDKLASERIPTFGPTAAMAVLEGSKVFTKLLCRKYGIPTADFSVAESNAMARHWIRMFGVAPVIKADGLCAGKGVSVSKNYSHAIEVAEDMLAKGSRDPAYKRIVIEERLVGKECSIMAFCDDVNAVLLPVARDYKRAFDNDEGPNTGGMGAVSPVLDVDDALVERIKQEIILPTLHAFKDQEGIPYRGLLYAGIMLTAEGPKLIEYNVRFGDPEAQVILPRITSDIVDYMLATLEVGGLAKLPPLEVYSEAAVCVVIAADGYPDTPKTGMSVTGNQRYFTDVEIFHGSTKPKSLITKTTGGRIFSVVGHGDSISKARARAYDAVGKMSIPNTFNRTDIARDM